MRRLTLYHYDSLNSNCDGTTGLATYLVGNIILMRSEVNKWHCGLGTIAAPLCIIIDIIFSISSDTITHGQQMKPDLEAKYFTG